MMMIFRFVTFYLQYVHYLKFHEGSWWRFVFTLSTNMTLFYFNNTTSSSSNKLNHYQVCQLVQQRGEWAFRECDTLYRMAHIQIKSNWQNVWEELPVSFKKALTWDLWKYSLNTENIQNKRLLPWQISDIQETLHFKKH